MTYTKIKIRTTEIERTQDVQGKHELIRAFAIGYSLQRSRCEPKLDWDVRLDTHLRGVGVSRQRHAARIVFEERRSPKWFVSLPAQDRR